MTPERLLNACAPALAVAGLPAFAAPDGSDDPGACEVLRYIPLADGAPACWALVPLPSDAMVPAEAEVSTAEADLEDILPLDVRLAAELIRGHLRKWLADRGWQVQLKLTRQAPAWRLADCLAVTEGGGDRLDDHYPSGEDELTVLCESVVTLARHGMA